eukprot:3852945-Rhodomonas_salina.4
MHAALGIAYRRRTVAVLDISSHTRSTTHGSYTPKSNTRNRITGGSHTCPCPPPPFHPPRSPGRTTRCVSAKHLLAGTAHLIARA